MFSEGGKAIVDPFGFDRIFFRVKVVAVLVDVIIQIVMRLFLVTRINYAVQRNFNRSRWARIGFAQGG